MINKECSESNAQNATILFISKLDLQMRELEMIKRMLNYIMINTKRAYGLFFIVLIVGLILIILTVSTHELDDIELSEPYEIVIFIIFLLGLCLSYLSVIFTFNTHGNNLHRKGMMEIEKEFDLPHYLEEEEELKGYYR